MQRIHFGWCLMLYCCCSCAFFCVALLLVFCFLSRPDDYSNIFWNNSQFFMVGIEINFNRRAHKNFIFVVHISWSFYFPSLNPIFFMLFIFSCNDFRFVIEIFFSPFVHWRLILQSSTFSGQMVISLISVIQTTWKKSKTKEITTVKKFVISDG